ncbi:protein SOB FIVE-LIKE 5-like [Prosopis cineraria]|uniref:protein SOB FIVE-LIKE 5-like n=1 Tax=Prosopis cineraria TaxID=364024 RepID=UPI002410A193|nr:protein SOB FIVE-LIKE 5-like [Prosopis cineraria]
MRMTCKTSGWRLFCEKSISVLSSESKMNAMASECSSGCESGWTLYLEHSFLSKNVSHMDTPFTGGNDGFYEDKDKRAREEEDVTEEEDLSMVSDASSGPPHFQDDEAYLNEDNGCFHSESQAAKIAKTAKKKQKVKENEPCGDQHLPSFLDDTASSPVFDFAVNNGTQTSTESVLDHSQGFSATYFEERSSIQDHYASDNHLYQKMNFRTTSK